MTAFNKRSTVNKTRHQSRAEIFESKMNTYLTIERTITPIHRNYTTSKDRSKVIDEELKVKLGNVDEATPENLWY